MDLPHPTHYFSPCLRPVIRPEKGGNAVIAARDIAQGELLVVWGGYLADGGRLATLPDSARAHSIQVEEDLYLVSPEGGDPADYINHSCAPNAGLRGQIALIALRDIRQGEEVCYDYATSDGSPYDEFPCACGAPECRGRVSGDDWRRPDLQRRYAGHFSPYLQRRIDALARGPAPLARAS